MTRADLIFFTERHVILSNLPYSELTETQECCERLPYRWVFSAYPGPMYQHATDTHLEWLAFSVSISHHDHLDSQRLLFPTMQRFARTFAA